MRTADLIAVGTSFCITCVMLPIILRIAGLYHLHDPAGPLKIHTTPTPRLGGVAITMGLLAGIAVSGVAARALGMLLVLLLVWLAGLIDDLVGLSPFVRLMVQALAGLLMWREGWSPRTGHAGWDLVGTVSLVVCFVNVFNMLDGADGIAAGVSGIITVGFIFLSSSDFDPLGRVVEFSLLGACISFLLFNFPPAKIFMGDSGSNVIGFALAVLVLSSYRNTSASHVSLVIPFLLAGLPLLDGAFAVVRRLWRGMSPFEGDRDHFYDLLLKSGWSPRKVAFASYALACAFVLLGLFCRRF